ncbi:syntenin-1, putative [Pediculus humanus corporis]|uniref:Syntenin-1, putative n=1 Tax=Pediculus humanus subsp. corporis TaxID=121224 RepID=E0VM48_PEDHC|nr:syntenin-1, putative [Pediculus humanus corporis]EEB14454.1 syntenin-1, putative [Pediculus humanus corporis]
MALYPSLEDLKVDQAVKAQNGSSSGEIQSTSQPYNTHSFAPSAPLLTISDKSNALSVKYPALNEYMGLELTREVIAANMPEYLDTPINMQIATRPDYSVEPVNNLCNLVAPVSGHSLALYKAHVTNGIRQLTLCKDGDKKVGLRVQPVNNGVFVNLVTKNSPAAMAGFRFGDQILEVNGKSVAGLSMDAVHDIIKKSPSSGISFIVRDRPFERTVTLHKDKTGHVGFTFKEGKVTGLVVDSSAAKNGLLTEHNLLEINGQNVVGLKDKEITKIIADGGNVITVTIVPSYIYQHMTKSMSSGLLKNFMDRSVPTF